MGTKNNPGAFDCHAKAEPDEPIFCLVGRDPAAGSIVRLWIAVRLFLSIQRGDPTSLEDLAQIEEASATAEALDAWALARGKALDVGRARAFLAPPASPETDRAVQALDQAMQFAPKACREAMQAARAALVAPEVSNRQRWEELRRRLLEASAGMLGLTAPVGASRFDDHALRLAQGADDRVTPFCQCGARPPDGADADAWFSAHAALYAAQRDAPEKPEPHIPAGLLDEEDCR